MEAAAGFCRSRDIGAEVTAFAYPQNLEVEGFDRRIRRHRDVLAGVEPLFVHGPFLDLYVTSPDPEIVAVAGRRHARALTAAAELEARIYVAHLNFNPIIRNRDYRDRFVSGAAEFWTPLADRASGTGTTIVLENLWEPDPHLQKAVVEAAGHPNLKASFDNGHALVFSDQPAARWIRVLGADLLHVHLHDNGGACDEHRPVGEGSEDWAALLGAWREHAPGAALVLESDRLDANVESLSALDRLLEMR